MSKLTLEMKSRRPSSAVNLEAPGVILTPPIWVGSAGSLTTRGCGIQPSRRAFHIVEFKGTTRPAVFRGSKLVRNARQVILFAVHEVGSEALGKVGSNLGRLEGSSLMLFVAGTGAWVPTPQNAISHNYP